jgi:PAS domain-containing protein
MRLHLPFPKVFADPLLAARQCVTERLKSLPSPLVCTDLKDRVVYLNSAAKVLLGWTETELFGRPRTDALPLRQSGTLHELVTEDGRVVWLFVRS